MQNNTLSSMWSTRPHRIPKDQGGNAYIAGVCEGIAVRFQIDPTLPRVLFVITTLFFGGGIVAYLLAWGLMPLLTKDTSPLEEILRKDKPAKSEESLGYGLLVGIVLTAGIGPLLSDIAVSSWLTLLLFAGAWYLVFKRQPQSPTNVDMSAYRGVDGAPLPPEWDPLGVAPDLWDLPEPQAPQESRAAKKKWPGIVALVIGGVILLGAATMGPKFAYKFDGGSNGNDGDAFSSVNITPASVHDLQPNYTISMGALDLDLSNIEDWDSIKEPKEVTVNVQMSDADITLPTDIPLQVTCNTDMGNSDCVTRNDSNAKLALIVNNELGNVRVGS